MSMQTMDELREMLCRELEGIGKNGQLSAGDLDTAHKLTDTIKNIDKIAMMEDSGYSQADDYMPRNSYGRGGEWEASGTYGRGHSYNGDMSRRGRGYSRADGQNNTDHLRRMLNDPSLTPSQRDAIGRALEQMER